MAAIKGQPSPKPGSLESPVPGKSAEDEAAAFMADSAPHLSPEAEAAAFMNEQAPPPEPHGLVEQAARGAINALPGLGTMGGAALGTAAGPVGTIAGAGLGAAAGLSLKRGLENWLFGDQLPQTRADLYGGLAKEAGTAAAFQAAVELVPGAVAKAESGLKSLASKVKTSVMPEPVQQLYAQSNGDMAVAADQVRTQIKQGVDTAKAQFEEPTLQLIQGRATNLSDREVGDSVKQLIKSDVEQRYGPFKQAYQSLNEVSRATPIPDEARRTFGSKLTDWALNEFPENSDSYRLVRRFKDSFEASNSGLQFENALKDVRSSARAAYQAGDGRKGEVLNAIAAKADDFLEGQVEGLAKRISAGKASPEEMGFLNQVVQSRGIQEADPSKYATQLASDFLSARTKVKADYRGFKEFMDNLSGATKIRSSGTMNFLDKLDDVPSEKLVAKMFDERNSAALEQMKKETPEVFKQLASFRVKELAAESVVKGELDATKFWSNVKGLPPEVRNVLFSPEELTTLESVAQNPKLMKLNDVTGRMDPKLLNSGTNHNALVAAGKGQNRGLNDLGELSLVTGQNFVRQAQLIGELDKFSKLGKRLQGYAETAGMAAKVADKLNPFSGIMQTPAGRAAVGQGAEALIAPREKRK